MKGKRRWIDPKDFRTAVAATLAAALLIAMASAFVATVRAAVLAVLGWLWTAATWSVPIPAWLLLLLLLAAGIPALGRIRRKPAPQPAPRRPSRDSLTDFQWACMRMLAHSQAVRPEELAGAMRVNTHRVIEELARLEAMGLVQRHRIFQSDYLLASRGRRLLMDEGVI